MRAVSAALFVTLLATGLLAQPGQRYDLLIRGGRVLDGIDLEDLLSRLSEMLLSSGFNDPYSVLEDDDGSHSMQALHDAILEALLNGALPDELLERLLGKDWQQAEDAKERVDRLVQQ